MSSGKPRLGDRPFLSLVVELSNMFNTWKVSKVTGTVGGSVNIGVLSLTAQMGLDADRKVDVLESAKAGVSPCNIQNDMLVLDAALGELIKVRTEPALRIRDAVESMQVYAAMAQVCEVRILEFFVKDFSDAAVLILSVLLSVGKVLGRTSAVTVTRSFIEKVAAGVRGKLCIDKIRLENLLRTLIRDVNAGGSVWMNTKSQNYDTIANMQGAEISSESRFAEVTYGMMVSLLWWLYKSVKVGDDSQGPQICKTYDSRLHKVVYLLEQFGWPVRAALVKTDGDFVAGFPRVLVRAHACGQGVEDMPLLQPDEVEKHGLRVPQSGSGMVCKYKDIGKVLRARVGSENDLGLNLERGWEEGWKVAMSLGVELEQHFETNVYASVQLCRKVHGYDSWARAREKSLWRKFEISMLLNVFYPNGGPENKDPERLQHYLAYFHWMHNGTVAGDEAARLFSEQSEVRDRSTFREQLMPTNGSQAAIAGLVLGYLCGSVFKVSEELGLAKKDDVTLNWLGKINEFLWDLNMAMKYLHGEQGMTMGRCLDLIAVCFYGEAERLADILRRDGKNPQEEYDIVGTLAGDKVLLLEAVVNPTLDFQRNCQIRELDYLPINIPSRDGKYILSAKTTFNRSQVLPTEITPAQCEESVLFQCPSNTIAIIVGPNLIQGDGTVMHSMYSCSKLVHCSSIMDAFSLSTEKGWKSIIRADGLPRQGGYIKFRSEELEFCEPMQKSNRGLAESSSEDDNGRVIYSVSDIDLIDRGVILPATRDEMFCSADKEATVVVQVFGNDLWRYTASSMYKYWNSDERNVIIL